MSLTDQLSQAQFSLLREVTTVTVIELGRFN